MSCYVQGCSEKGHAREYFPPRSFVPKEQREKLVTARACERHHDARAADELYVLAHILNAAPPAGAPAGFMQDVAARMGHDADTLRKALSPGAANLPFAAIARSADIARFDRFFDMLSCGIVQHAYKRRLPAQFGVNHVFHDLNSGPAAGIDDKLKSTLFDFYSGKPRVLLKLGEAGPPGMPVYSAKIFGQRGYRSSITIVHNFLDAFRVTSMLAKKAATPEAPARTRARPKRR